MKIIKNDNENLIKFIKINAIKSLYHIFKTFRILFVVLL